MELEWDTLNEETFGSDVSDAEDSHSWERRHFEFVAATTGTTQLLQPVEKTSMGLTENPLTANDNNERNNHVFKRHNQLPSQPSSHVNNNLSPFCTPASFELDPLAKGLSRGGNIGAAFSPPSQLKIPPPGFETCTYEVAANKSKYPLNNFSHEQSLSFPSEKSSISSSFLPFEIEVDNFPFERRNDPSPLQGPDDFNFEQSLAKSFDEMFNEDLLEEDFGAPEESLSCATGTKDNSQISGGGASPFGSNRRARNISESELFPDSYKFSPPFPSVNISVNETGASSVEEKNIWDMEHQENDNDYINRHIKALLKIQPSPKTKTSLSSNKGSGDDMHGASRGGNTTTMQDTHKVYTLEELEDGAENISSFATENNNRHNAVMGMGASVNQLPLPIGTPPKRSEAMAAAELMKHVQKLGGIPIQKGSAGGTVPNSGAPAMSIQDQLALAQLTQAATAAYLRDKHAAVSFNNISSPPRLAAGIPHNVAVPHGPAPRNVPYPHPIPQGGRVQRNNVSGGPGVNAGRNHPHTQQLNRYHQNNNNHYNQRGPHNRGGPVGHMKEHEPIVKGLMSQKEMEWIFKVQMMQLKMSDFHVEDYYYQQWVRSKMRSPHQVSHSQSTTTTCSPSNQALSSSTSSQLQISQKQDISTFASPSTSNDNNSDLSKASPPRSVGELAQLSCSSVGGLGRNRKITETSSDGEATNSNNLPSVEKGLNGGRTQAPPPEPKKVYEPTRFDNTLGKISVGSVYKPRKLMDIEFVCRESYLCPGAAATGGGGAGSNILKDSKRHREHLLFIEKCLTLFDELELAEKRNQLLESHSDAVNSSQQSKQREQKQRMASDSESTASMRSRRVMRKERDELRKAVLKHFHFNHLEDIVKNILLCAEKGCRLLGKLLTLFSDEENVLVMLAIVNNLYVLIKKEQNFAASQQTTKSKTTLRRKLFGSSLCVAMREAINQLESNIDNVEILEILVSTVSWKTSTFATSLLVVLLECIARGKQHDSFSYKRLVEILSLLETHLAPPIGTSSTASNGDTTSNDKSETKPDEASMSTVAAGRGSNKNGNSSATKTSSGSKSKTTKPSDVVELYEFVTSSTTCSSGSRSSESSPFSLKHTLQLIQTDVRLPHFSKFILSSLSASSSSSSLSQ